MNNLPALMLAAFVLCLSVAVSLAGCDTAPETLDVTVSFNDSQYAQSGPDWVFPLWFPLASDQVAGVEYPSLGNYLGATIVQVNIRTNQAFHVTGVRLQDVRYRATNSSTEVEYLHPVLGRISPVFPHLPTSNAAENPFEAIAINPDADNVFEVGLSSVLGMFAHMDFDCDGTTFTTDDNEVITLEGGLYFEGFFSDGREFGDGFPMPLHLTMTLQHGTP